MKSCIRLFSILFVFAVLISCEKNDVGPSYKKVGTSTSTNAFISVSTTTPLPGTSVAVTLRYVNIESDPAQELVLFVREGSTGTFTKVTSFEESSQPLRTEITRTHNYIITQLPGTQLTFRLELHTQKDFPKLVNSSVVTVQVPAPIIDDPHTVTSGGFTISWSQVDGVDGYRLDVSTVSNFSSKISDYDQKVVTGLSEVVGGLSSGTTYYIRVYAAKGTLRSLPSEVKSVTTD